MICDLLIEVALSEGKLNFLSYTEYKRGRKVGYGGGLRQVNLEGGKNERQASTPP